ncbi:MAG: serine hydrolase domain-containing protein [Bacteroidota bacterium]
MTSSRFRLITLILGLWGICSGTFANNGTLLYAQQMDEITVDGELSDWPSHIAFHPLEAFLFGAERQGDDDILAHYRVGYCLRTKMLYVAVVTTDDAVMGDKTDKAEWDTHDMHNLMVDPSHQRSSGAISHLVSQDYRRIAEKRQDESWDPQVRNASWDNVAVQIKVDGNRTTAEWSFYLGDQMRVGRTIGFDYEVIDKDPGEEGFPSVLAIGPGIGKSFNTVSMSDLLLIGPEIDLGTLKGQINWAEKSKLPLPKEVVISSKDNPACWVVANVNKKGHYAIKLPKGTYQISLPYSVRFEDNGPGYAVMDMSHVVEGSIMTNKISKAPELAIPLLPRPDIIAQKGMLPHFVPSDKQEVDEFMNQMMAYYKVPGVSLALVKGGELVYHQTYGYKNAYTKEKVEAHTLFEAASVTKPVFAFAVNRLVERGEFDLDKPLHEYLPFEDIASDERYKLMTGRHVLVHTSGLPNWGREMKETPGTTFGYSGEGFEYLKRAVVHVTQRDIEELVETEVLKPLGMSHTYFSKNEKLIEVAANGHYDDQPTMYQIPGEAGMAHSMYTEARTFANFMIGILERKGLQPATYEEMLRPQTLTPTSPYFEQIGWEEHFGLGIVSAKTPYGDMYGHGGNNGDFRCQFEIFDDDKLGFAIFTNGSNGHLLIKALREFLITGKVEFPAQ